LWQHALIQVAQFTLKLEWRRTERPIVMDRRSFLKTAAGAGALTATCALSTPAISQRAAARTLRFVPQADLANFDPIWSTTYVVRNASVLVWDTLYGLDDKLVPQRQMVEAEEVAPDGLTWTFRLRPALKFHDGEPVLAKDAVASIRRWAARDVGMGQRIKAIENELTAIDDRTFRWVLKKPFPRMRLALGKLGTLCCFVMPARIAATDPFRQINEYVGSGPMRFLQNEWVPGARAVFEKFVGYVPRQEPASWLAGGRRMSVDRIEWTIIADPATAAAALQNGEVDWWEEPILDLVPLLRKNRNVMADIADPLGNIGYLRMNHLHPPFNDVRARRAILMALSQEDYMRTYVGDDNSLWKPMLLHAGHPTLQRGGWRNPQRSTQLRCRQTSADGQRLCGAADHLPGGAGYSMPQGVGRPDRRSAQAPWHEGRFYRN
jgi:peptide/nickel transport system substrate-binding protein